MVYINRVQEPTVSYGEMNLRNEFKFLALEISFLIRSYIAAVASGYGDANAVADKLYSIPTRYKERFQIIFGMKPAEDFLNLLLMYFVSVFTLVNSLKSGDKLNVDASATEMYNIADEMATYFAKINPFWNEVQWKNILYTFVNLVIQEAVAFLSGDFKKDLDIHDRLAFHSLIIGDYIADGIMQYLRVPRKE